MKINKKACVATIVIGALMIILGVFFINVPGGALTTYSFLDGDSTTSYCFSNKYVAIDEYVGGDAYNFEIGASLVAGKTAGAMTSKSIFIVGGLICVCIGLLFAGFECVAVNDIGTKHTIDNEQKTQTDTEPIVSDDQKISTDI